MKTLIRSNVRALEPRAFFYTLILCIAALVVLPGSARAQIYVSSNTANTVGEYDATTGAAINANFITGVISPAGLVLSGNTLFVASRDANATTLGGEYNATTGAAINAITGVNAAAGLALRGNTLFVANYYGNSISIVATTGAPIATPFISGPKAGSIYGNGFLAYPWALALSGNNLYVSQNYGANSWVGEYDATTGATINPQLITTSPAANAYGLALSSNGLYLFVAGYNSGTVGEYDATTGAVINANFITGLSYPTGLAVVGNTLYVTSVQVGSAYASLLSTYNATTGAVINANFITGLPGGAQFIAVAAPQAPIANAGSGQTVQVGTLVALNGSGSSDPSGQLPLTYAWSFVSKPAGSTATLSNPAIVNPTFTPDALGNYVIQLVVTDAAGLSSAPATVTISTTDAPPVANAGPNQTITAVGTVVQLNGAASYDLAGLPITYQWSFVSKPAGSSATLTGPTTATPTFVADVAGNYTLQLVVTDSLGTASSPAEVTISFSDVPPVANAGTSQSTVVGESVTLNGSKSTDSDGEPLSYSWSVVSAPSGSKATISNPTAEIASFVPDLPGTYVVQLIVNDGILNSTPATVEIMAISQQTSLTQQIQQRQGVIQTLPNDGFRFPAARELLEIELNGVLFAVEHHEYRVALLLLETIAFQTDGCFMAGGPRKTDLITNCADQTEFYPALAIIIGEVKALVPPRS